MNLLARRENDFPSELERAFPGAESLLRDVFGFSAGHRRRCAAYDLTVGEKEVNLQLACPGHKPGDLDVELAGSILTVKTCCQCETKHHEAEHHYTFSERPCMDFEETFHLPVEVTGEGAKAFYEHGVLNVTLPRELKAEPPARKIQVCCGN